MLFPKAERFFAAIGEGFAFFFLIVISNKIAGIETGYMNTITFGYSVALFIGALFYTFIIDYFNRD